MATKAMLDELQHATKSNQSLQSIADMRRFIDNYPEFRKLSGNVSKHITLLDEVSRIVAKRDLLSFSVLEQELAVNNDHSTHFKDLEESLKDPKIAHMDKVRLAMLYCLRYENNTANKSQYVRDLLSAAEVPRESIALIPTLLRYAGTNQRTGDLFSNKDLIATLTKQVRHSFTGGTINVFTQHVPYVMEILDQLIKGKLKETDYPNMVGHTPKDNRPQDIIVFMVGGTTYEEALHIAHLNSSTPSVRVVLGGTTVHNSTSFFWRR